ncbi:sodium:solute symporter family protein [Algoriphagus antarcticus]|uniref:SSS family transporter n=1 Tax=Algoriphagus antarcticus TaxID=238540 RepID=A0A3E0D8I1_9BACT|nr:sodium:solute symporter family protein [Algoriphagus antarcticus]REG78251.1 SSS family transporter [Algoriphagus antarcticus]
MEQLDYITIIIFSLIILGAGLSFATKGTNMKSFFAAGGAVPWPMNGLSLFMSFFSAGTFVVWGSIAYQFGLVAITIQMSMCIAGFVVGYFIAPRWWKSKALTVAEFLTNRFGKNIQQYYTYLFLFLSLGYTGAFLYPVAKIVNVTTGFDINLAILLLGGMIMIYTAVGGLWAVVVTDVLQFVILTAAVLLVIPLSLDEVQGFQTFVEKAPDTFFNLFNGEYTVVFIIAFTIYNIIFIGGNWAYVQRYTSVKDAKASRKVGFLFGALYLVSPLIWMLPPMIYRVLNPGLEGLEAEGAYLMICMEVLPVGVLGLMIGGMIFATASSVNTSLNLAAAVLTNDIFKPLRPNSTDKTLMNVARLTTILFGLGTIGVAFLVPMAGGIVEVVLSIAAVTGGALYGPAIWALFSKKQNGKTILGVTIVSLTINLIFKFFTPLVYNFSLNRTQELLLGVGIPILLLVLVEIFGKAEVKRAESIVYSAITTKAEEIEEAAQNNFGVKVLGISLVAVGLLFGVLSVWAVESAFYLVGLGISISGFGAFLYWNVMKRGIKKLQKNF